MTKATEAYNKIVDRIINMLEQGTSPWQNPVVNQAGGLPLRATGEPYQGMNILACWMGAMEHGWTGQQWFTFKQMAALGGRLVEGSKGKGTPVFYYGSVAKEQADGSQAFIPYSKVYTVWNSDQIEGLPERYVLSNELAKTQQVTLHMLPHEVPELIEGVRRGAESLRKESNRHLSEGRADQAMRAARQAGVMEVLLDLLTHEEEEAA